MDNSINFRGAWLLKQPSQTVQKGMLNTLKTLGCKKQIFENFTPEGDILYVTRKGADRSIAEYLSKHRVKFECYTDLTTKSHFDIDKPVEDAKAILSNYKSKIITTISELKKYYQLFISVKPLSTVHIKKTPLEKALIAVRINPSEHKIVRKNGFNEIYDMNGKLTASVSEPDSLGFRYITKERKTSGDEVERYAVRSGEVFTYKNDPTDKNKGTQPFLKNYINAVKENRAKNAAAKS